MTETNKTKKISRRDAIKVLGAAAGATVLANLPSKWSTPELASGVLPAHAQTSGTLLSITSCSGNILCPDAIVGELVSVTFSPAVPNISMTYIITTNGNTLLSPASTSGSVLADINGVAELNVAIAQNQPSPTSATLTWSFTPPAQGSGTCSTVFSWDNSCNN